MRNRHDVGLKEVLGGCDFRSVLERISRPLLTFLVQILTLVGFLFELDLGKNHRL